MADKDPLYVQCRFSQRRGSANRQTVAWVELEKARVGRQMQFRGEEEGWWTCLTVGDKPMPLSMLRDKQNRNRGSLPSVVA